MGVTFAWRRYFTVCADGDGPAFETRTQELTASRLGDISGDSVGLD